MIKYSMKYFSKSNNKQKQLLFDFKLSNDDQDIFFITN